MILIWVGTTFDIAVYTVKNRYTIVMLLIKRNMENDRYESPNVEIIKMQVEQSLLISSVAGEDIYEWEDM